MVKNRGRHEAPTISFQTVFGCPLVERGSLRNLVERRDLSRTVDHDSAAAGYRHFENELDTVPDGHPYRHIPMLESLMRVNRRS